MNNQSTTLTKEELQRQSVLPSVYKEALERAINKTQRIIPLRLDDPEEALCSNYFRAEVVACESENALRDDDKLKKNKYMLQAIWFRVGWKARRRTKILSKNDKKLIYKYGDSPAAIWLQAGWTARQRMEVSNENIAKTISKATRRQRVVSIAGKTR